MPVSGSLRAIPFIALVSVFLACLPMEAKSPSVRVGLSDRLQTVSMASNGGLSLLISGKESILSHPAGVRVDWNGSRLSVTVLSGMGEAETTGTLQADSVRVRPASVDLLELNGARYRGTLEVYPGRSGLRVINEVSMEEYLYSVVPSEMFPSWNLEALKAQAVAARTYTIRNMLKHSAEGHNLCATEHCQVYKGVASESARTTQAVVETEGVVAVYGGKPIDAQYHSSSGGMTEDSQSVWSGTVPYLKAVESTEVDCPHSSWMVEIQAADVSARFERAGYKLGTVLDILPVRIGRSGRFVTALVRGSTASVEVSGSKLRSVLGLNSALFVVDRPVNVADPPVVAQDAVQTMTTGFFRITGRGFGHGVGLSQWGAKTMAELGNTFDAILEHYYTGIALEKWSF